MYMLIDHVMMVNTVLEIGRSFNNSPMVGCDMGAGHTAVLWSQVTQVQVQFQKSRPEATP